MTFVTKTKKKIYETVLQISGLEISVKEKSEIIGKYKAKENNKVSH